MSKTTIISLVVILVIGLVIGAIATSLPLRQRYKKLLDEYERQHRGELTEKERQLQNANQELGTIRSRWQEEVAIKERVQQELSNNRLALEQIDRLNKTYKLRLDSYQKIVASLQDTLKGLGEAFVSGKICSLVQEPIPYRYIIKHANGLSERISLTDADICAQGDETLVLNQTFTVDAIVYQQKDGFLKTQQAWVSEIDPVTGHVYNKVTIDTAKSSFDYDVTKPVLELPSEFPFSFSFLKFNDPLLLVSYDSYRSIGAGLEWLRFWRIGANLRYNHRIPNDDAIKSRLSAGLLYHLGWKDKETNIGLGASVSTPVQDIASQWLGTVEITFDLLK